MPGQVAQALAQLPEAANGMTLPVAGLVMAIYAVALWLAGLFSMRQRDVS